MDIRYIIRKLLYILLRVIVSAFILLITFQTKDIGWVLIMLALCLILFISMLDDIITVVKIFLNVYFSKVSIDATIVSYNQKVSDYGRKSVKRIETTVTFSDGFKYITDLTNYNIGTPGVYGTPYSMCTDDKTIMNNAIKAHNNAVKRKTKIPKK